MVSRPPYLKSEGLSKRFSIVDSTPILLLPPFKTYLIFEPNSSFTSDALTELSIVDIFENNISEAVLKIGYFKVYGE